MVAISGTSGSLDIEGLSAQYRAIERTDRVRLTNRLTDLEARKSALSELDSKLSALYRVMDNFTDTVIDPFATKTADVSNPDLFAMTAGSTAELGSHSLEISQLAKTDTRVSVQYTSVDTSFSGLVTDKTFDILVAHPTDADSSNRETITVTVAASVFTGTDEEVMQGIASAVNDAMGAAVIAETIDTTERITATAVSEESGKIRLILRSGESGESNALQFTDTDGLLGTLEVNRAAQMDTASNRGGYITAAADLNALFKLDGLDFVRDSNAISDVLTGITITLIGVTSSEESFTVSADQAATKTKLDGFIEKYNDVVKFLAEQAGANGPFRGDSTYGLIRTNLRSLLSGQVTGALSSDYDRLFEIGIETHEDGTIYFADSTKLNTAVATDTQYITKLFASSDGLATEIKDYIHDYTRAAGLISSSKQSLDTSLRYQNDRIDTFDDRVDKRVERFRDQLIELQTTLARMQSMSNFFQTFGI